MRRASISKHSGAEMSSRCIPPKAGELLVEDGLALHHRHRGHRPDIPQSQHPRSVRADGDAAPDHGQLARERGVLDDGLARPRYPWRVHVAHILNGPDRVGRLDHELPALVLEERPITRPHDLDAFESVEHPDDPLGLVAVIDLERDLAQRGLTADVDRRHVSYQAAPIGYRSGDPRKLARAVRDLDAVGVIEWHGEPPNVPDSPCLGALEQARAKLPHAWIV
jgi:hypothetical protein